MPPAAVHRLGACAKRGQSARCHSPTRPYSERIASCGTVILATLDFEPAPARKIMEQNHSGDATQSLQSDVDADGNSTAPEPLAAALRTAAAAPGDDEAWDALEEAAATLQRPDDVAML